MNAKKPSPKKPSPKKPSPKKPSPKKPSPKKDPRAASPQRRENREATAGSPSKPRLGVEIDGRELGEAEAREMWTAFSGYMDANEGDFAGFARARGFSEARPEHRAGRAILVLRR